MECVLSYNCVKDISETIFFPPYGAYLFIGKIFDDVGNKTIFIL